MVHESPPLWRWPSAQAGYLLVPAAEPPLCPRSARLRRLWRPGKPRHRIGRMKSVFTPILAASLLVAAADCVRAQDQNAAAERARIANQRIYAESEQRRRESEDSAEAVVVTAAPSPVSSGRSTAPVDAATSSPAATSAAPVEAVAPAPTTAVSQPLAESQPVARPASESVTLPTAETVAIDLAPILEQIRTLGELKDAGYVTDEEFERIKRRLLDGSL